MSEQAEVGQQEVAQEQGASAGERASAIEQRVSGEEQNVPTQESGDTAMNAQSLGSGSEGTAGDQDVAPLKDLDGKSLDGSAVNSSSGIGLNNSSINGGGALNMDSLMDVPVTLSVEIGRKRMPINQLVNLAPGAIVDLNRDLDAPIDLLVNGTLIARGEVVVMGKKFGLRLVDICSPNERLRSLT